jgi:hypothetical protein
VWFDFLKNIFIVKGGCVRARARGGGGLEVNFVLFHLTCRMGKGRGLVFFLKNFFSLLKGLGKGARASKIFFFFF